MKKCLCCGHENTDEATKCEKCFAGFPHEKKLPDSTKENSANGDKLHTNKRKRSE